ncbi:hypothetical protein [Streptomyces lavendofoliae]|uniref:Secreted protein n=1 Tax=Streptomyces lavendofoliae TaxID=67314 RepID=A0A918HVD8_9ACTN|nr:hypothetical protein [Streptomyces lavendofoliae]GGU32000.1 hypothetical protein GCM10010274_18600 [Streptomyces lavendofoliae]
MNTGMKISAFAAALAATFGTAYGVGKGVGPVVAAEERPAERHDTPHGEEEHETPATPHGEHDKAAARRAPGGLQISEGGHTLALQPSALAAGTPGELRFRITDAHGRPVTAYEREHGKELHLVLASRDLTVYRHLHPVRGADGTWSTPVELPEAGDYRAFADFTPAGGEALTLGADLAVSGAYRPAALPAAGRVAEVDGYRVELAGAPAPGRASELTLRVSRGGRPVTDLQPYLGAYGHLVALRAGDLAYLHVHPHEGPAGPEVSFTATAPSAGAYRLFLDFKHDGKVRTAAFTVHAH